MRVENLKNLKEKKVVEDDGTAGQPTRGRDLAEVNAVNSTVELLAEVVM